MALYLNLFPDLSIFSLRESPFKNHALQKNPSTVKITDFVYILGRITY